MAFLPLLTGLGNLLLLIWLVAEGGSEGRKEGERETLDTLTLCDFIVRLESMSLVQCPHAVTRNHPPQTVTLLTLTATRSHTRFGSQLT
jgi:hypothetical protein